MTPDDLCVALTSAAIVPILGAGPDFSHALSTADALVAAGATAIEVLFRHPGAPETLAAIKARHPGVLLAAGTVLDEAGATAAVSAGADFMISPGLSPGLHKAAQGSGLLLVPGVNTASEVQQARELGYLVQKFYPGFDQGHQRLPEFAAIYGNVRFLVTGGVDTQTLADFARHGNVAAVGGTWMLESADASAALATDLEVVRAVREGRR